MSTMIGRVKKVAPFNVMHCKSDFSPETRCIDGRKKPEWLQKFPVVKMNETYDELR